MTHRSLAARWRLTVLLVGVPLFGLEGREAYLEAWKKHYPQSTLPSRMERETGSACRLCHDAVEDPHHDDPGNCYRETLHVLRHETPGAFATFQDLLTSIEGMDSDADGVPNRAEILWERTDGEVGYHPGLAGDEGIDRCGARGTESISGRLETPPVVPALVAEPQMLGFGDSAQGVPTERVVVVRNAGTTPRQVTDVSVGRVGETGYFAYSTAQLPQVLGPGEEIEVRVSFVNAEPGYYYQLLAWPEVISDDPVRPTLSILARSRGAVSRIRVPDEVTYGVVNAGESHLRTVTISNDGDLPLRLMGIDVSDPDEAFTPDRSVADELLDSGSSTSVRAVYRPSGDASDVGRWVVRSDDPFRPEARIVLEAEARWPTTIGDANQDGGRDISDAVSILGALFRGSSELPCAAAADANADGRIDISDAIYLLRVLFQGDGPAPGGLSPRRLAAVSRLCEWIAPLRYAVSSARAAAVESLVIRANGRMTSATTSARGGGVHRGGEWTGGDRARRNREDILRVPHGAVLGPSP